MSKRARSLDSAEANASRSAALRRNQNQVAARLWIVAMMLVLFGFVGNEIALSRREQSADRLRKPRARARQEAPGKGFFLWSIDRARNAMSFEQFCQIMMRRHEAEHPRSVPQPVLLEELAADVEEDVGAVRLLRLRAALKERRGPGSEG